MTRAMILFQLIFTSSVSIAGDYNNHNDSSFKMIGINTGEPIPYNGTIFLDSKPKPDQEYLIKANSQTYVGPIEIKPSVLSGRPQQHTIGERFVEPKLTCASCTPVDNGDFDCVYHDINLTVTLELYSGYGGHEDRIHDERPLGVLKYGHLEDGDIAPDQDPSQTQTEAQLTVVVTANDQYTPNYEEAGAGISVYFPEAAQEVMYEMTYNCPDFGEETYTIPILFRASTKDNLVRLEDYESNNQKARLLIERLNNSHGDSAGYATSTVDQNLQDIVDEYGGCPVNANLPEGQYAHLVITGASLPPGGKYDIYRNWKGPHLNHRSGEDIDIGLALISSDSDRLTCFKEAIDSSGMEMPVSAESIVLDPVTGEVVTNGSSHVHLWSLETNFFGLDQTEAYKEQFLCLAYGVCS